MIGSVGAGVSADPRRRCEGSKHRQCTFFVCVVRSMRTGGWASQRRASANGAVNVRRQWGLLLFSPSTRPCTSFVFVFVLPGFLFPTWHVVMSYRTLQTSFVSEIPPPQTRQDTRAVSHDARKNGRRFLATSSSAPATQARCHSNGRFLLRHRPPRRTIRSTSPSQNTHS